jgi:Catalase
VPTYLYVPLAVACHFGCLRSPLPSPAPQTLDITPLPRIVSPQITDRPPLATASMGANDKPASTFQYNERPVYTTSNGCPVESQQKYQRISNGPLLLQDFHLIDLLAHFDRERIPERVVHAKGAGAYGEVSFPYPAFFYG